MYREYNICLLFIMLIYGCEEEIRIAQTRNAPGQITVLDTGGAEGQVGWWPRVIFDNDDQPHVSYCDVYHADLKYATRSKGQWEIETVVRNGRVGKYIALDVNQAQLAAILFYDQDKKTLRFAWQDIARKWKTERVAWGLEVGMGGALRFDQNDVPHIFYYIPSGKLIHAYRPLDKKWKKEVLSESLGGFSVKISPHLNAQGFWLSFVDWNFKDTRLLLARPTKDAIIVETVTEKRGPGWRSYLYMENQEPRILYSQSFKSTLRLAKKIEGEWRTSLFKRYVGNFSAKWTNEHDLIVAYEDITNGKVGYGIVTYLRKENHTWSKYIVDREGPVGRYIDMDIDSQGRVIIAYYSDVIRGIKLYDETQQREE